MTYALAPAASGGLSQDTQQPEPLAFVGTDPRSADLDAAATTPALRVVADAVETLLATYASVHRGSGWKSRVTSGAYEGAREAVREFVGARADDHVVFTRGTTEAANLLSACLPEGSLVVAGAHEHHANLLPWARHHLRLVPLSRGPQELLDGIERRLVEARGRVRLVALTGASNVSGELFPVAEAAALAHSHGALLFLDAAQLAPHRAVDVAAWDVDYVALSGHKLHAPYGSGALVGRPALLDRAAPFLRGGGASGNVTRDRVQWVSGPQRHEAGSPNVVGAVALGVACDTLRSVGMDAVADHERALARHLFHGLARIPGVTRHTLWPDLQPDRLAVSAITVDGWKPATLADALACEHGVGVRAGRFCAHQLVDGLTGGRDGLVRASLGLHSSHSDVARFLDGLDELSARGPRALHAAPRALPEGLPFRVV